MTASTSPDVHYPFYYHRLPNGLEMIGQHMPSLGSAVFGFQIDAGAVNEVDDKLGVCQLLEDMLFQGTPTLDARHVTDAIELLGARRITGSGYETARYGAQVVHTRLDAALTLWADLLLHPTFPAKEFEQLRPLLIQAIKRRDDEPMRKVGELMSRIYYANSRMARPLLGTVETVNGLTIADVQAFYAEHYHPNNTIFAIAGNFDWDHVVAMITKLFGDWTTQGQQGYREVFQVQPNLHIEVVPGEQEHIYMGYPSVTWGDPDYYANVLASEILGGGMTSRLFSEVREKRGLVYHVGAYLQPARSSGAVFIYAGTQPDKGHETTEVIISELQRLYADGVTQDELDRAKIQVRSEFVMQSESANARMSSLLRSWWYEHRLIPIQEVKDAIDAVTVDQISGMLKRYPPTDQLTMVAYGPTPAEEITANIFPLTK